MFLTTIKPHSMTRSVAFFCVPQQDILAVLVFHHWQYHADGTELLLVGVHCLTWWNDSRTHLFRCEGHQKLT